MTFCGPSPEPQVVARMGQATRETVARGGAAGPMRQQFGEPPFHQRQRDHYPGFLGAGVDVDREQFSGFLHTHADQCAPNGSRPPLVESEDVRLNIVTNLLLAHVAGCPLGLR